MKFLKLIEERARHGDRLCIPSILIAEEAPYILMTDIFESDGLGQYVSCPECNETAEVKTFGDSIMLKCGNQDCGCMTMIDRSYVENVVLVPGRLAKFLANRMELRGNVEQVSPGLWRLGALITGNKREQAGCYFTVDPNKVKTTAIQKNSRRLVISLVPSEDPKIQPCCVQLSDVLELHEFSDPEIRYDALPFETLRPPQEIKPSVFSTIIDDRIKNMAIFLGSELKKARVEYFAGKTIRKRPTQYEIISFLAGKSLQCDRRQLSYVVAICKAEYNKLLRDKEAPRTYKTDVYLMYTFWDKMVIASKFGEIATAAELVQCAQTNQVRRHCCAL